MADRQSREPPERASPHRRTQKMRFIQESITVCPCEFSLSGEDFRSLELLSRLGTGERPDDRVRFGMNRDGDYSGIALAKRWDGSV